MSSGGRPTFIQSMSGLAELVGYTGPARRRFPGGKLSEVQCQGMSWAHFVYAATIGLRTGNNVKSQTADQTPESKAHRPLG